MAGRDQTIDTEAERLDPTAPGGDERDPQKDAYDSADQQAERFDDSVIGAGFERPGIEGDRMGWPTEHTPGSDRQGLLNAPVDEAMQVMDEELILERVDREHHSGREQLDRLRDDRVRAAILERLDEEGMLDTSDIDVAVRQGEVRLSGAVASRGVRILVEELATSMPGVTTVVNDLRALDPFYNDVDRALPIETSTGAERASPTASGDD